MHATIGSRAVAGDPTVTYSTRTYSLENQQLVLNVKYKLSLNWKTAGFVISVRSKVGYSMPFNYSLNQNVIKLSVAIDVGCTGCLYDHAVSLATRLVSLKYNTVNSEEVKTHIHIVLVVGVCLHLLP